MEPGAKGCGQPILNAVITVPDNAFKERVNQSDQRKSGSQLRIESRTLGDAARHNRRNGSRKGQQEKEFDQVIAIFGGQDFGTGKEADAIGHAVTHKKVGNGGDRKIGDDFDQGIDLVFLADRAQFQKGKTGMHGQHHNAPQQHEQHITAGFQRVHATPPIELLSL